MKRHRESLSSFFAWCVSKGYIAANPVKEATPPKDRRAREVVRPLPAHDFEAVVRDVAAASETYAALVSIFWRTGIRWGEARAMLVRDFVEVPMPALNVVRNQPEGTPAAETPKSGRGRRVPLPDALVPALRRFAEDKGPDDLLLPRPGGGQLHRSTFARQTGWSEVGRGRTLRDLRHTAACECILRGVPLTTMSAWLGHASIEVTARYLHPLGDSADRSALQLLNDAAARVPSEREQPGPRSG
ncbi:MAG: tyrosine-type recombinase/integrase [Georgenia sp.]